MLQLNKIQIEKCGEKEREREREMMTLVIKQVGQLSYYEVQQIDAAKKINQLMLFSRASSQKRLINFSPNTKRQKATQSG